MRLIWILLILFFAVAGAIFGALNGDAVAYDFYFATFIAPKGAMLITSILLGWLLGGAFVYLGLVLRLRRRLRAQATKLQAGDATAAAAPDLATSQSSLDAGRR